MKVLKFPHPDLLKRCSPVLVFGPELKVILEGMWDTMVASRGIGLSANQVGLSYRAFVMQGPKNEKLFIINPHITMHSSIPANLREGCLSAPGEFVVVNRASWVEVEFQDVTGAKKKRVFEDIYAVCVQHEIDHLNGESHLQSKSIPKQKRRELAKKWGLKFK